MLHRYMIYSKEHELKENMVAQELRNTFLELKYPNCNVYESWCCIYGIDRTEVFTDLFIEVKSDLFFGMMYEELKREVLKIVSVMGREFGIPSEEIKIYFNSINGFYIVIPVSSLGFLKERPNKFYLYLKETVSFIIEKAGCNYVNADDCSLKTMHMKLDSYNVNTGYAVKRISESDLSCFSVTAFLRYCKGKEKESIGVSRLRTKPVKKMVEIIKQSKVDEDSAEVLEEVSKFFETDKDRRKLDYYDNLEAFQEIMITEKEYSEYSDANYFLLYSYNKLMLSLKKIEDEEQKKDHTIKEFNRMLFQGLKISSDFLSLKVQQDTDEDFIIYSSVEPEFVVGYKSYDTSTHGRNIWNVTINTGIHYGHFSFELDRVTFEDVLFVLSSLLQAFISLATKEDWFLY